MTGLKNCPFCNGKAMMQWQPTKEDVRFTYSWVVCTNCFAQSGTFLSAERAIEAWNRREGDKE